MKCLKRVEVDRARVKEVGREADRWSQDRRSGAGDRLVSKKGRSERELVFAADALEQRVVIAVSPADTGLRGRRESEAVAWTEVLGFGVAPGAFLASPPCRESRRAVAAIAVRIEVG